MPQPSWCGLPTGYFTHELVDLPNPLADAPESPDRMEAIETRILAAGMDDALRRVACGPAPREAVLLAHDADYLRDLERASEGDPSAMKRFTEPDTIVGPNTFRSAMASAGAVVRAVDALWGRSVKNAFCAVRPPGHHAGRAHAAGFCYINSAAVGVLYALARYGLKRAALVDIDAHHGNGSEEILAGNRRVQFFSFFQWPLYPNKRMMPAPENVVASPLPAGADGSDVRELFENDWLPKLDAFAPELIVVSAGFDAHVEEHMAQLKVGEIDYAYMTRRLLEIAERHAQGRLVSVLEGGYALRSLARSVLTHLQVLLRAGRQ